MQWRAQIVYRNEEKVSGVLRKNTFLAGLLGSQYLFEILETAKIGENVAKSGCFKKTFVIESANFFFQMKERNKVSYLKILIFS